MKRICPECGNNLITAYRRVMFCDEDIKRRLTVPVLTYVCKSCGFSVTPKSAVDRVYGIVEGLS